MNTMKKLLAQSLKTNYDLNTEKKQQQKTLKGINYFFRDFSLSPRENFTIFDK